MHYVLVLSDSHGYEQKLSTVLMHATSLHKYDAVIFLGDGAYDLEGFQEHLPIVYSVRGNCDFGRGENQQILSLYNRKILITHGHLYHVKSTLSLLKEKGEALGMDACLFGHTHKAYMGKEQNLLLLNPGAACEGHFAVLTIEKDCVMAQLY